MSQTDFEYILNEMLSLIPDTLDKREGSIIYNALAPAAASLATAYINLELVLRRSGTCFKNIHHFYMRCKMKKFLDYLPALFSEITEFQHISFAVDKQITSFYQAQNNFLEDQFISTASASTLCRYENMLGITSNSSLEDRRLRLLALFSDKPPYSYKDFTEWLESICGIGGYSIELYPERFYLDIRIAFSRLSAFDDIARRCRLIIPANIQLYISPMYTTHGELSSATHELLSYGTHQQTKVLVKESV